MSKVVELSVAANEVNHDAAELIEGLLSRIVDGETVPVAFVEVGRGGVVGTAYSNSRSGEYHRLNSGAARLAARLANTRDDD